MDLVLEIGHSFSHTNDYLSGEMNVHSHKIGGEITMHHDHYILKKIEKATDQVGNADNGQSLQAIQFLKFDQIKLILLERKGPVQESCIEDLDFNFQLRFDKAYTKFPTPPPQNYRA